MKRSQDTSAAQANREENHSKLGGVIDTEDLTVGSPSTKEPSQGSSKTMMLQNQDSPKAQDQDQDQASQHSDSLQRVAKETAPKIIKPECGDAVIMKSKVPWTRCRLN